MERNKKAIESYKMANSSKDAAGFLKVTREKIEESNKASLKAAHLLLLLDKDEAVKVMSKLTLQEAEKLAGQIASIKRVEPGYAKELLEEFDQKIKGLGPRRVSGGVDTARNILTGAFGSEKAQAILKKVVPEEIPAPFAFLEDLTFNQLKSLLQNENPVTLALIMPYLEPANSAKLLKSLPDDQKSKVVLRMAKNQKIPKEVVITVEESLKEKVRLIGKDDTQAIDGQSVLAGILKYMDTGDEKRLIGNIDEKNPQLAKKIREKLITMDVIFQLQGKDLQKILNEIPDREIAVMLKCQPQEICDKILSSISARKRSIVQEEFDLVGPIRKSEVDAHIHEFLEKIRIAEEKGTLMIMREGDDYID